MVIQPYGIIRMPTTLCNLPLLEHKLRRHLLGGLLDRHQNVGAGTLRVEAGGGGGQRFFETNGLKAPYFQDSRDQTLSKQKTRGRA